MLLKQLHLRPDIIIIIIIIIIISSSINTTTTTKKEKISNHHMIKGENLVFIFFKIPIERNLKMALVDEFWTNILYFKKITKIS